MRGMNSETVDLIYLDPPFKKQDSYSGNMKPHILDSLLDYLDYCYNSNVKSEVRFAEKAEAYLYSLELDPKNKEVIMSFNDAWEFSEEREKQLEEQIKRHNRSMYKFIRAVPSKSTKAYLVFMGIRIIEMHRILRNTGSIFLHCDYEANSYIRILLDLTFGENNQINEIVWCYTGAGSPGMRQFNRKHQTIYWYSKSSQWTFNSEKARVSYKDPNQRPRRAWGSEEHFEKEYIDNMRKTGKIAETWWAEAPKNGFCSVKKTRDNLGYPTQKPVGILKRIIEVASNEDEIVFDPFAGCATTCHAAYILNRKWITADISFMAVILLKLRLWLLETGKWYGKQKDLHQGRYSYNSTLTIGRQPQYLLPEIKTSLTTSQRYKLKMRLFGEQIGKCKGCGQNKQYPELEMDHIKPKALNGSDSEENFQLLCRPCNSKKGMRHENQCRDWMYKYTGKVHHH